MTYGTIATDVVQSSTTGVPTQFNDGSGTQIGTLCRAWVNYKGTATQSIRASFNVSSVTYNGTGDYTINFTNAMPDANYSINSCSEGGSSVGNPPYQRGNYPITSTTNVRLTFFSFNAVGFVDPTYVCFQAFR